MCLCWVAQSCLILFDPMNYSPLGSSDHGILQARILEWVAIPSSRGGSKGFWQVLHLSLESFISHTFFPPISNTTFQFRTSSASSLNHCNNICLIQFSPVQLLSHIRFFATPWTAAHQASMTTTNSQSSHKLMCNELVMPSNHLILCRPLPLLPSIPPSIRDFSNESTLCMRWPKHWSFSLSISPFNEHPGLSPLEWTGWISLQSKGLSRVFSNTTVQKHQFFRAQRSSQSDSHIHTWPLEKS